MSGARIAGYADETHSGTATGSTLRFYTADNTTTTLDERMRIDHNGYVGLGGVTNPLAELHLAQSAGVGIMFTDDASGNYRNQIENTFDGGDATACLMTLKFPLHTLLIKLLLWC